MGFSLDYCDTQNTSNLELKQCLHTTWDPLLLHYYVSPKTLAPFRTLLQLFSTVSQPMSETFKTVIWTHCHCYKGPRFDSISMTQTFLFSFYYFYFNVTNPNILDMVFFFNHNYKKNCQIWLAINCPDLDSLIGQYASCLSNWTVRAITRALKWLFFFTASQTKFRISCVLI